MVNIMESMQGHVGSQVQGKHNTTPAQSIH